MSWLSMKITVLAILEGEVRDKDGDDRCSSDLCVQLDLPSSEC